MEREPGFGRDLQVPYFVIRTASNKADNSIEEFVKFSSSIAAHFKKEGDYLENLRKQYVEFTPGDIYYDSRDTVCMDTLVVNNDNPRKSPYLRRRKLSHGVCFLLVQGLMFQLDIFKPYSMHADIDAMKTYSIDWLNNIKSVNPEKLQ